MTTAGTTSVSASTQPCFTPIRQRPSGILTIILLLIAGVLDAAPYQPESDDVVLVTLPAAELNGKNQIARLNDALAREPQRNDLRAELGGLYLGLHRQLGDPRYLGYAQAALDAAPAQARDDTRLLLLSAQIEQAQHHFAAAAATLDAVIRRDPAQTQAWLMRSALAEIAGDYARARGACTQLVLLGETFAGTTCAASVASVTGRSAAAYETLVAAIAAAEPAPAAVESWAQVVAAEIALRRGDPAAAQRHLRRARALEQGLLPTINLADLYLDTDRAREALALLAGLPDADAVLLRRAIAKKRLGHDDARTAARIVAQRVADPRRRDERHAREQAMYALYIAADARAALAAAQQNWARQKERIDARLLLEAALAANAPDAADAVVSWMDENDSDDVLLVQLRQGLGR